MATTTHDKLAEFQEEMDEEYLKYVKKDFEVKLAHHKNVLPILKERDSFLKSTMDREELDRTFADAFKAFDAVEDFLPLTPSGEYYPSFIKFITAEYLDDEKMRVTVELYENEYVKNETLQKTIYLIDKESEGTQLEWKGEPRPCILFDFFVVDEDSLDLFDIIYEFYINLVAYATLKE